MTPIAEPLKALMRSFPQAVTIVTAEADGEPFGVTVSAFSTLSLEPPLVMISLIKGTRAAEVLSEAGCFAVSLLSSDQSSLSERFAGRLAGKKSGFDGLPFARGANGCMVLQSGVGHLECDRAAVLDEGDHTVVVGRVTLVKVTTTATPLIYYNRRYTTVAHPTSEAHSLESMMGEW